MVGLLYQSYISVSVSTPVHKVSENSLLSNHVELVLTTTDMVGLKDSFLPPSSSATVGIVFESVRDLLS